VRLLLDPEGGSGGQIVVKGGEVCRIGRSQPADCVYPDDFLSSQHFAIECLGTQCRVLDLNSRNGTFLNGARIQEAILEDGCVISAGQTKFRVRIDADASAQCILPEINPSQWQEPKKFVLESLRKLPDTLFALLDAARNDRVLDLLQNSGEKYQSLYEGQQGRELDRWAPYLVELPNDSRLLLWLLHEGWGNSWGVFLACNDPFAAVRKHFRHFLMVDGEGGQRLYFRFYDPRVLRVFLAKCTDEEAGQFFGPVGCFFLEGTEPEAVLRLSRADRGAQQDNRAVSGAQSR